MAIGKQLDYHIGNVVGNFIHSLEVKSVIVALALYVVGSYLYNGNFPELNQVLCALIFISISSFIISEYIISKFQLNSNIAYIVIGAGSYFGYFFLMIFFKLTPGIPVLQDQLYNAGIFGVLTALSSWMIIKARGKK